MPVVELITPQATQRFEFRGPRFVLGRVPSCHAVIDHDSRISREHCEIVFYKGQYILHDLKSRNGTLVSGKPIEAVKLVDRGVFQVGGSFVRFFLDADSAKATPAGRHPTAVDDAPLFDDEGDDDEPIYDVAQVVEEDDETAPIPLEGDEQPAAAPTAGSKSTTSAGPPNMGSLGALARIGQDPGFGIESLSLLNARGQVVHQAGAALTDATESLAQLQLLTLGAIRCNASDIHLEPKAHDALIRVRIDGAMVEVAPMSSERAKKLTSLIKVLCDIDIARKSIIQEGHFSLAVPGRTIDYRVSFAPAMYGQKMVLRVLDPAQSPQMLADLDMPRHIEDQLRSTAEQSTGTMFVCGPTGSGKTTTLYAVLRQIDAGVRNVITIEDPIEYEVHGVTQIPVDTEEGHTFGNLLRTCLRQDPDVIVLGEVRDRDTAVTAMQAATTGHLVLSTLHANDTVSTVLRLLDLGVEPYLIASTLEVVLAQRLVRRLCDACKKPAVAEGPALRRLGKEPDEAVTIYEPVGCESCFDTGYAGRVGIFELLTVGDAVRDVILSKPNLVDLKNALADTGFQTLRDHAIQRVLAGVTSLDDAHRMVGLD
jgi:type II secretory ATPase GspE/PulE/Tfp pilus assembly ATPase PilB-like protein/pSer/pThr/pTyr-binding forkhead associated (FHA) protein